jgi:hypothetical protein
VLERVGLTREPTNLGDQLARDPHPGARWQASQASRDAVEVHVAIKRAGRETHLKVGA